MEVQNFHNFAIDLEGVNMPEIYIEEMKDKNYEDNILIKVFLYYMENIDDAILNSQKYESLAIDTLSTDWFRFDGAVYSLTVVYVHDSKLKTVYVNKFENEESYCLGSIALVCKEKANSDHKYTIKITDIDFQ